MGRAAEIILEAIRRRTECGQPLVAVRAVRRDVNATKAAFDFTVLDLAKRGVLHLYQHDYPASLTEDEREDLVISWHGKRPAYYNGISVKHR